ncbi:MAG: hypothetical protein RSB77_05960 [Bacilli bacterium]
MFNKKFICICTALAITSGVFVSSYNVKASQISSKDQKNINVIEKSIDTSNKSYNLSKDDIFYNMLNAIDNYTSISGKFIYSSSVLNTTEEVTYNIKKSSKNNNLIFDEEIKDIDEDITIKSSSDGENYKSINSLTKEESTSKVLPISQTTKSQKSKESRMYIDDNGDPCYVYREETSLLSQSALVANPEIIAMGFMGDFNNWNISGYDTLLNRKCVVIDGKFSGNYKTKMKAQNFKLYIDAETGVLIKLNTFDNAKNIVESLKTTDLNIN